MNQQLLEYVKSQLSNGVARVEIENALMVSGGWSKSDIDGVFALIVPVKVEIPQQPQAFVPSFQNTQAPVGGVTISGQGSCYGFKLKRGVV